MAMRRTVTHFSENKSKNGISLEVSDFPYFPFLQTLFSFKLMFFYCRRKCTLKVLFYSRDITLLTIINYIFNRSTNRSIAIRRILYIGLNVTHETGSGRY